MEQSKVKDIVLLRKNMTDFSVTMKLDDDSTVNIELDTESKKRKFVVAVLQAVKGLVDNHEDPVVKYDNTEYLVEENILKITSDIINSINIHKTKGLIDDNTNKYSLHEDGLYIQGEVIGTVYCPGILDIAAALVEMASSVLNYHSYSVIFDTDNKGGTIQCDYNTLTFDYNGETVKVTLDNENILSLSREQLIEVAQEVNMFASGVFYEVNRQYPASYILEQIRKQQEETANRNQDNITTFEPDRDEEVEKVDVEVVTEN